MNTSFANAAEPGLWNTLFGLLPYPACVIRHGIVYDANPPMLRLLSVSSDELPGPDLNQILATASLTKAYQRIASGKDGQLQCTLEANGVPMLFTCRWKSLSDVDPNARLLTLEPSVNAPLPTALEKDLYDDLQGNRKLIEHLIDSDELERKKLSDYLHDEIGSLLATAKHQLNLASQSVGHTSTNALEDIDKSILLLDRSIERLRHVAMHAAPVSIEFGLTRAVHYLASSLSRHPNVDVRVIVLPEDVKLPGSLETVVYRIVQELLQNAIRHADASEVVLQIIQHAASVTLVAEDNGKGFDVKKEKKRKETLGLKRVQQRVELFQGKMDIDSAPGKGTVVTVEIPYNQDYFSR